MGSKFLADHTNLKIFRFLAALSGLRYMDPESVRLTSEFPLERRRVWQVETWRPSRHLACSPLQSYPCPAEVPQALAPQALGAPGYGRTWEHLIAFSRCGLKFFFRVTPSCVYIAEITETRAPAQFSLASSTARRSAVRCRAVPYCPVLCRALRSVLFRAYQTTTLASIQCWLEPACSMSSSILYSCSMLSSFSTVFFTSTNIFER